MAKTNNYNALSPRQRAEERVAFTLQHTEKILGKWKMANEDRDCLNALLGRQGRSDELVASDLAGLLGAGERAAALLSDMGRQHPDRRFYFFSFADDAGNTLDRAPTFRTEEMKKKACVALRSLKLSALLVVGFHPFVNYPAKGRGRLLAVDVHAIAYTDADWDHQQAQKVLNASRTWYSTLTHKPVVIKEIDPLDLERVAYYMFKPWHSAKNVMPHKTKPDRFKLMDTRAGYRPEQALRVFEGLSQIPLTNLIVGISGGKVLRQRLREQIVQWHRSRPDTVVVPATHDTWMMWLRLRETNGSKKYSPYRFDGGAAKIEAERSSDRPRLAPRSTRRENGPPRSKRRTQRRLGVPRRLTGRRNPPGDLT